MSDNKLLQNTLAEATTENGFPTITNTPLQREVTLETGETVIVEGITPDKMKAVLNQNVDGNEGGVTFLTPGENYNEDIKGVCQVWNTSIVEPTLVSIAITTAPTKTTYYEGDLFDTTGMVITATYSNTTTKNITDYTVSPSTALATTDTIVTITYNGKTAEQTITVQEDNLVSIAVTTAPTKTTYNVGEYFDPTGMVVTGTLASGRTMVISDDLTYNPDTSTALATTDTEVTISYFELSTTQAITVE